MRVHSVHKLIEYRKSIATKPFNARGSKVERCEYCQISKKFCICEHQPDVESNIAALIIMSDNEVLKPSNTGRLIADVITETYCYQWSRTEPSPEMLALLKSQDYQPVVIFPEEYVVDKQRVELTDARINQAQDDNKRLLLIFLDGSWREARRIFNRSPYLDNLPVLSVTPDKISEYLMRKSDKENHLSTAEVCSLVLEQCGEPNSAKVLSLWFELFRESYLLSKTRIKQDLSRPALQNYQKNVY